MALTDKQTEWFDSFTGRAIKGDQDAQNTEARGKARTRIESALGPKRDGIRNSLEGIEIVDPGDGSTFAAIKAQLGLADKIKVLEPGGDPVKELDIWHDTKILKGLTEEQRNQIMKAMGQIMDLSAEIENMTVDGRPGGEPLYGGPLPHPNPDPEKEKERVRNRDAQIAKDLWQPLVREGIIPENFVPPRFSEVESTFGEAAKMYEERLQEYSKDSGNLKDANRLIKLGAELGKLGFDVAASVLQVEAGVKGMQDGVDGMEALKETKSFKALSGSADTLALIGAAISGVGIGVDQAITERDVVKSLDGFILTVTKSVAAAVDKKLGAEIGTIATAIVRAYPIGKKLKAIYDKDDWDGGDLTNDLGTLIADIGAAVAAGMDHDDKDGGEFYSSAGKLIQGALAGVAAGVKTAKNPEDALEAIAEGASTAASSISGGILGILKEQRTEEVKKEEGFDKLPEKEQKKKVAEATQIFDSLEKGIETGVEDVEKLATAKQKLEEILEKGAKAFDKSELKRLEKLAEEAQNAALKERMEMPDTAFEAMLVSGFSEEAFDDGELEGEAAEKVRAEREERKLKSIEALIAVQKKHEATYKLATSIVSTFAKGGAEALKMFPGVGIAPVATQMIFSFYEAYKQGQQFLIWLDNVEDAEAASTVQVEAMMNRFGLSKKQTIEAGIKAALNAAKLVGEVMKLAGHIAPAGYAVSAAASGGAALLEIASKVVTASQMQVAWMTYRTAFETPADRKAARMALRENPTLAKYAMAYGAVVDGNPIAVRAMTRCGLNETTLADPGTNVSKVVTYLETIYKDDPILLRAVAVDREWYPGKVALTSGSWTLFIKAAQKSATPKLLPVDATAVAGGLLLHINAVEKLARSADQPVAEQIEDAKEIIETADRLITAFALFKPLGVDPTSKREGTHKEVAEYAATLSAKTELSKREAMKKLALLQAEVVPEVI